MRNLYLPTLDSDAIANRTADWSEVELRHPHAEIRDSLEQRLRELQESIEDPVLESERAYLAGIDAARKRWGAVPAAEPATGASQIADKKGEAHKPAADR